MIDEVYRYSVKCNRTRSQEIQIAARAAGLSVEAFVQRHFDGILDAAPTEKPSFDAASFDLIGFSRRHNLTLSAARIWLALRSRCDGARRASMSREDLCAAAGIGKNHVTRALDALEAERLIEQPDYAHGTPGGATYLVRGL
jgi:hypothetical protein